MTRLGANTVPFDGFDFRTAMAHIKWAGHDGAWVSAINGMCGRLCLDNGRVQAPGERQPPMVGSLAGHE